MSLPNPPRQKPRRSPLGDATSRVNNTQYAVPSSVGKESATLPHNRNLTCNGQLSTSVPASPSRLQAKRKSQHDRYNLLGSPESNAANPRLSAISRDSQNPNSNRNSHISTTSTNGSDGRRRKTHIGPWHLGKTLGKGATARVRMARHAVTGQLAAIKIVQKKNAQLSQAGSLAALDQMDTTINNPGDGARRMPFAIEREVAVMKLIQHPHIMKLYDIWENRTEIYLVLEYIDNGELFEHISKHGWLSEEESLRCFRQVLSAVGYCHSFNICHRDLKPENILLTKNLDIKVADFGMAALHQTPQHRLQTSCGSPHYAAPEVVRASFYRGDKADIWSMGVILFASLAGHLPFDHESLPGLLEVIRKGRYEMPSSFGPEAADLIHRMLQLNPRDRLSISQMWRHPLIRKYDYLDDYGGGKNSMSPEILNCECPLLRRSDIDRELLRHLRSMWHTFEEQQIIQLLLNDQPNDQKLFYNLLLKHREAQLENYVPDMGHSTSDYHHVRPLEQVRKLSTRQFSQPNPRGHGRAVSRFTVVSNVSRGRQSSKNSGYAETEAAETVQSYDPFRASRSQNLVGTGTTALANVVVHRGRSTVQDLKATSRSSRHSVTTSTGSHSRQNDLAPPRIFASRSSLASSTLSRGSARGVRVHALQKRGVSFSHIRRSSGTSRQKANNQSLQNIQPNSPNVPEMKRDLHANRNILSPPTSARYIHSKKATNSSSQPLLSAQKQDRASRLWNEDVRQLSSSLAKTCDEAFNRTSVVSSVPPRVLGLEDSQSGVYDSPISSFGQAEIQRDSLSTVPLQLPLRMTKLQGEHTLWDARPLPPTPARSDSLKIELAEARKKVQLRKISGSDSPGYLDRMVAHIDQLLLPASSPLRHKSDRRTVSAPTTFKPSENGPPLPSINESKREGSYSDASSDYGRFIEREQVEVAKSNHNASAPEPSQTKRSPSFDLDNRTSRRDPRIMEQIRVVPASSPSPAKPPAPLNIRKKSSYGPSLLNKIDGKSASKELPPTFDLRQQYAHTSRRENSLRCLGNIAENNHSNDPFTVTGANNSGKQKSSWIKRSSRSENDERGNSSLDKAAAGRLQTMSLEAGRHSNEDELAILHKKKRFSFGRLFTKRTLKQEFGLETIGFEIHDDNASIAESIAEEQPHSVTRVSSAENSTTRQIEPQQNWLARLFHVKPANAFICFSVSKRRARQEMAGLLKEWRKYGAKDIVVDKERNIVFGRVGPKNYFQMKEVAFASEILTVIEHGKRSHLSIARFTQEKGAASSFYRVVETLETILKSRGMLVSDERKKRMIIKTLNAN